MMLLYDCLNALFPYPITIFEVQPFTGLIKLLASRKVAMIDVAGIQFYGVFLSDTEKFSASVLKKQLEAYERASGKKCAYVLENASKIQLSALIRYRIPFIALPLQVYLPFWGIMLSAKQKEPRQANVRKMMPATQELFLYMFYNQNHRYFLKSEVAKRLNLTKTSMTRASEQLIAMNIVKQEKVGKEYRMELVAKNSELYEAARGFLISPVVREFYIDSKQIPKEALVAGESALSQCSDIASPKIPCFAIHKDNGEVDNLNPIDIRWEDCEKPALLQLWKYDPVLFCNGSRVDTVSMICSLSDISDERLQGAIEDIVEEGRW